MTTYKLENCKKVFDNKEYLINLLKELEQHIHGAYSIIQNDDIVVNNKDIIDFEHTMELIEETIGKFQKWYPVHIDEILAHIEKCKNE